MPEGSSSALTYVSVRPGPAIEPCAAKRSLAVQCELVREPSGLTLSVQSRIDTRRWNGVSFLGVVKGMG